MIIRYATAGGETKTIVFDATLREVHTAAGTVTEHAVEKGGKVSDHFRPSQKRVSIEAVISNTPIKPVGGKTGEVRAVNLDVKDSHVVAPGVRLPNRRSQGAQVLQFSQQFDYQDMVIVSLSAPREAASGSTITVTIDAVHIRFVETSTVDAPAPRKQNKRTKRGNKGTKEIKPEEKKKRESAFHAGKDWALGQIGLR
jgi:hypothetical protein